METLTDIDFDRYKQTAKECKKEIRKAKMKFECSIANNGNKRPFNSYIRLMATILNTQFSSVFTSEDASNIPICPDLSQGHRVANMYFDEETVRNKIHSPKLSTSSGPDGLSTKFIYDHAEILSYPLAKIHNLSLESGTVPQEWREANVTPIFKNKGSKSKAENYRPISLTSIPCKIMESIICDKVVSFLTKNKLIKDTQHGFIANRSCTTNLLEFMKIVTKIFDEGTHWT